MFKQLEQINHKPKPFEFYTAEDLWTDEHTAKQMLSYHLNKDVDLASRRQEFIDRSVDWIVSRFSIGKGRAVVDFGCGPGFYTNKLAKTGARVVGIDFSKNSLEWAQKKAKQENSTATYINQNYLEFESYDRFDLIMMIFCDFCALSPNQRKKLLNKFYSMLALGGSVLLDVSSLKAFEQREENALYELNQLNGFWSAQKYYGFLNTFKYEKDRVMLDKYTIVEEHRIRTVYNWLQYFDLDSLKREFENSGLTVSECFSNVAGDPYNPECSEFAVVAKVA